MKAVMIFYPRYCYDCQMQYFGVDPNKVKPCTRCGSTNVVSSPLTNSKQNMVDNNTKNAAGGVAGGK